ncbi:MAG: prepilin-type N-terminal cleavage/methylation domain-containing protein [Deltaproteobacteria bacterium]|nr:prepilin-type N-terminal cleavage/methylation domain-containing protein [Deltaproteobacteria bacterium]
MFRKHAIQTKKTGNHDGFTIIEVVIAMAIFAIGILAVASLQVATINGNSSARKMTDAVTLAENRLETMMNLPYAGITGGQAAEGAYTISWSVAENVVADNTKFLTVTVTHPKTNENILMQLVIPRNN